MNEILHRLINRRDTAANWSTVNPILEASEIGYDTTVNKYKMGDGTTAWNDLDYYNAGSGETYGRGNGITIDNNTISVNARASQFAFSSRGEMYLQTSGDSGFVTNRVLNDTISGKIGDIQAVLESI